MHFYANESMKPTSSNLHNLERKREEREMKLPSFLDMEKEISDLNQVSINGSVKSFLNLLQENPSILNKFTQSPSSPGSESPLHISALLGHLDLTRELLTRKPELTKSLNPQGLTALHIASAKGHVEIVRELVLADPVSGFVLDLDGRSALHLGAIRGRVGVLRELIRVDPEMARVLTSDGESCLHLCVKYNQFESLKVLVESVEKDGDFGLVNWKDQNGNNVLHLAVANKQIEIIKFLLSHTPIDAKSPNANGFTALHILSHGPRDLRDMLIKQCLNNATSTLLKPTPSTLLNSSAKDPEDPPKPHKHTDWLGRRRSSLMIVASLLATTAFQASLSPPGGVWQDHYRVDSNGNQVNPSQQHEAGQSVMAYRIPRGYGQFMIFNTIAFLASLSIIMLLVSGLPMKRRRWMWIQMVTMWVALTAQTITYFITLIHMTPKTVAGTLAQVTKISVLGWLSMMSLVFIGNVVRVIRYFLMKYGYIEWKEKEHKTYNEEDENDEL